MKESAAEIPLKIAPVINAKLNAVKKKHCATWEKSGSLRVGIEDLAESKPPSRIKKTIQTFNSVKLLDASINMRDKDKSVELI